MLLGTPRRSGRLSGIPVHARNSQVKSCGKSYAWGSDPLYSRPSIRDDFLDNHEWEQARGSDDETESSLTMTEFHNSFIATGKKTAGKYCRPLGDIKGEKGKGKEGKRKDDGRETFTVGDTVLVTSASIIPSVAVIVGMWQSRWENDSEKKREMRIKVHWFVRPTELPRVRAQRNNAINEIFYSLDQVALLSPRDILTHCIVTGTPHRPVNSDPGYISYDELQDENGVERYYCHLALDSQRGLYYEIDWEDHHNAALEVDPDDVEGDPWDVVIQDDDLKESQKKTLEVSSTKRMRKPAAGKRVSRHKKIKREVVSDRGEEVDDPEDGGSGDGHGDVSAEEDVSVSVLSPSFISESDDEEDQKEHIFWTPSRKRKRLTSSCSPCKRKTQSPTTPRKRAPRRKAVAPTPHSRKIIAARKQKKALRVHPLPMLTSQVQLENLPTDPWLRAMRVLHVSAKPDALPCREEEYARCLRAVEELLEEGSGGCVYISGVPGTGKTATVHAIVRELKHMAEGSETNPFTYVEINGLRVSDPTAAYCLLWEGVSGHDVSTDGHLKISAKQSLKNLSRHFSAGGSARGRDGPGGHACVVLMDELDQLVTTRQDVVYNFFNWPTLVGSKLIVIAVANTMDLPERVMSGRVRSRLGMIRINFQPYTTLQLIEIVQTRLKSARGGLEGKDKEVEVIALDAIKFAAMKISGISGDARRILDICRRTVERVQENQVIAKIKDVKDVIQVMQNSPTAAYLRDCSLHEQIMLASLLKVIKREGLEEVRWGDVRHQHLIYVNILTGTDDPKRKPTLGELDMVLESLAASRAMLVEDGVTASRKAEGNRKVILNLEQGEVERVLSDFGGIRWKNALSG